MSLLTGDGNFERQVTLPPRTRLNILLNSLERAQGDVVRFQQEIRQMLAAHQELESFVAIEFKKPPRLVVNNTPPRHGRQIERYRPRKPVDDEGPNAA